MKRVFLFLVLFCMGCCGPDTNRTVTTVQNGNKVAITFPIGSTVVVNDTLYLSHHEFGYKIREFEYKGCEYIACGQGQSLSITHKGNCKYCKERNNGN